MEVGERPPSVFNQYSQNMTMFLRNEQAVNNHYLYSHQIDAVFSVRHQLENPQNPNIALVVLPTGCGKTGVAVLAAYVLNASRVLVITPSLKISQQIYEAFCGTKERNCFLLERKIIKPTETNLVCPPSICITNTRDIIPNRHFPLMIVNAHKIGGRSSVSIHDIPDDDYDLVIVDEAHHYPAPTWKALVDHFPRSRRLFLTATNLYKGEPILPGHPDPCFLLNRQDAVDRGIIRPVQFDDDSDILPKCYRNPMQEIAIRVVNYLNIHDNQEPKVKHQAMVLTQTIQDLNSAVEFKKEYDDIEDSCAIYVGGTSSSILIRFNEGKIRTLIIVGRLIEGYDNDRISVVAIARNVAPESKVLFAQFVGRAVRKTHINDCVTAMIVSHSDFRQRVNYDTFDKVAEQENVDDED